jgi:hypothetical protein
MMDEARAEGFLLLRGQSFESDASIPYAPLLDLVRLYAESVSPAIAAHVLGPAAAELTALFPELRPLLPDAVPSAPTDPDSDKRRLFHALARMVGVLAQTQPVFIAFEDVHWSDDATLDLVFHLARSAASQRVIIGLTRRSDEGTPRLERLIVSSSAHGSSPSFRYAPSRATTCARCSPRSSPAPTSVRTSSSCCTVSRRGTRSSSRRR